jgi:class 3 adenylate cyclase
MKRPAVAMLIVGFLVAASIGLLHGFRILLPIERPIAELISRQTTISRVAIDLWQYLLVAFFSFGVAALSVTSARRARSAWLALALLIELVVLTWVCSLYGTLFQPLPSILAVILALIAAEATVTITTRTRAGLARSFFAGRLSKEQIQRAIAGEIPVETEPRSCEVTVVVCDIANKYDLLEDSAPGAFAESAAKFLRHTAEVFLKAGGYIASADGEGVVAIFGFPDGDAEHANKALGTGLELVQEFRQSRQQNDGDRFGNCDVHLGVSSGTMIVAPLKDGHRPSLFTTGEPVELARRFCVANRFYGSRILMGPETFESTSRTIVARPIDFLSGVNSQERHEIYEPLWMAAEAKPEHLARRDYFWNGVVLYREKRWAEAYTEFQKARGPDAEQDAPLELYLRRLEPLALHLVESQ